MKTNILTILILIFFGVVATASAGDAKVTADLTQSIDIEDIEAISTSGTAEIFIGGLIANDNSQIKGEIDSKIKVEDITVQTSNGQARVMIGAVIAGQ